MSRRLLLGGAAVLGAGGATDDAFLGLLAERVAAHESVGLVGAVADADGVHLATAGVSGGPMPLDGTTLFEIGSVTKVFTALLLAEMAQRGEVALDDPIAAGSPIRLVDLATHTSGLPRLPSNFRPRDPANPYADYTDAQLDEAVRTVSPAHAPGAQYGYSNFGFGLLGQLLARRAGAPFGELVVGRICNPLGLRDTQVRPSTARLAPGHDADSGLVPGWDFGAMPGAGALHSSAHDMLRFLDAARGRVATPLAAAFGTLLRTRRRSDLQRTDAALGWFVTRPGGAEIVWKDGGTAGYASFIGYNDDRAAVLLSNTYGQAVLRTGLHLIDPAIPLPPLLREGAVSPERLERLTGRYAASPAAAMVVRLEQDRLTAQISRQPALRIYAKDATEFFYRTVDARLSFELGEDGRAQAVVLHQNGRSLRWTRQE